MEISERYKSYLAVPVKELPNDAVEYFVALFMKEASINMGSAVESETIERTLYFIRGEYSYLPIRYIGEAFIRGSLGKYGAGRLIPRTIHGWLNEISADYTRFKEHNDKEALYAECHDAMDLAKYPVGQAICKKIDWYDAGLLQMDDWDKISLKSLYEAIARKEHIEIRNFLKS